MAGLYTPKLLTVLREGYGLGKLRADAVAGLTVAIVALPLSMAIAIASGVTPDRGLYTAIVGGFLVSALGGSRFQIGGPAGAFIVLVSATVQQFGPEGLALAVLLSGGMLALIGALRLGMFVKYIPYPVTVGFTAGIAVIIFASQLRDLLGLTLAGAEPGPILAKLAALWRALPTANPSAIAIAGLTIAVILGMRRWLPRWPGLLVAVVAATLVALLAGLPLETIGTRFGGIPRSLPAPSLPPMSLALVLAVLPSAASFALLGSFESLLSAVVADSMTGRRHRANAELVAQGIANAASALFGGICVTGAIARTATNVRAGARGPISGMLHAVFLLLFMLLAAPLASFIPLGALAGVLAIVAWNMAERHAFASLVRASRGDAAVLLTTFLLVVFTDLTTGILCGFAVGALLFLHRMAQAIEVETGGIAMVENDVADASGDGERGAYDPWLTTSQDVVVCRISGAFFFGAASAVQAALDRVGGPPRTYLLDMSGVPFIDSTAAATIGAFASRAAAAGAAVPGGAVHVVGARPAVRRILASAGVRSPGVRFHATLADALQTTRERAAAAAQ